MGQRGNSIFRKKSKSDWCSQIILFETQKPGKIILTIKDATKNKSRKNKIIIFTFLTRDLSLTLQEAASGMHPEWQGGGQILPPYKNQFRGHFDKNNLGKFFWIRFLAQKMPFLHTFSLTADNSGFTSEIWKIDKKNNQNVPKTVDNH